MADSARRGRRGPRQDAQDVAVSLALGDRLRHRRGLLGISQQELGRRVGLTFQQVQKYERGHNRVSVPTLIKIAAALDTTPAKLLDGLDAAPSGPAPSLVSETLDREAMALLGASRQLPDGVRRAMLDLARSMTGGGADNDPTDATGDEPDSRPAGRSAATDGPATDDTGPRSSRRRRRGAVWDPSDIYSAGDTD